MIPGENLMNRPDGSSIPLPFAAKLIVVTLTFFVSQFTGLVFGQNTSIEYDHYWQLEIDENTVRVTVKGFVPFKFAEQFLVLGWCPANQDASDYFETAAAILRGEGTITARGEFHIDADDPEDYCHFWFEQPVEVVLNGKTWWKPNKLKCSDETFNFELNEDWTKQLNWRARCADPEQAAMLEMFLPKNLHQMLYSGEEHTLQFSNYEGAVLEDVVVKPEHMYLPIEGKLRYIFHSDSWSGIDWNPKGEQLRFDDSRPKPKDYPVPKGEWGPPLSEIEWKMATQ
jgi:hypothetical protein